jgi:hypothetical protein
MMDERHQGDFMKPLSKDIIDNIDWFAGSMVTDFYEPKDQAGRDRMERVDSNGTDLNLIMNNGDLRREAAAPGAEEAYSVVLTDIAMRISSDLAASHQAGEFPKLARSEFDPSIPLDPQAYNDHEDGPRSNLTSRLETPYDAAFEKGAVSPEVAVRLAEAANRAFPDGKEGRGKGDRLLDNRILLFADRVERVERQRGLSTDPEAAKAYDVVASDYGTKLAVSLKNGLEAGRVHPSRLTREDFAVIDNPLAPLQKGLMAQAGALAPDGVKPTGSKGPEEAPVHVPGRGVER